MPGADFLLTAERRIRDIIARVARVESDFGCDADLFGDVGVKSAAALDVLLSLEEEFGVAISDEAFGEARTLNQLIALVRTVQGGPRSMRVVPRA